MSDDRPKKPDATIQLDQVDADQISLIDSEQPVRHVTPPPLPPEELLRASGAPPAGSHAPPRPSAPAPAPRSMGKTVGLVAVFVVLIVVAIVGGLHVGGLARGTAPSASLSVAAAPVPTPKPTPTPSASASAPVNEITIPTIEMR
jgi:hypothetical protein